MARTSACWIVAIFLGVTTVAQQANPRFEVASVKPYRDDQGGPWLRPGGTVRIAGATVEELIRLAYELERYQLVAAPDWIRVDRYVIDARAGADVSEAEAKRMLQVLLEDRFKLVTHEEQRDVKFYALVLARPDGRLGPYIKQFGDDCTTAMSNEARKQFPPPTSDGDSRQVVGVRGRCDNGFSGVASALIRAGSELPVRDETGLRGKFTYDLQYTPSGNGISDAKSALEDQLGLTLVPKHGLLPVKVIDSVSQPTVN